MTRKKAMVSLDICADLLSDGYANLGKPSDPASAKARQRALIGMTEAQRVKFAKNALNVLEYAWDKLSG